MTTAPTPFQNSAASPAGSTAQTSAATLTTSEYLATTPGRMQAFAAAIALFSFLLWLLVYSGLSAAKQTMQSIGKDSAPSIIAAEQINAALADMDANAANGFFTRGQQGALKQYEDDRKQANDALITAAQNITFGDEERVPIIAITDGLQKYVGLVEQARQLGDPAGLTKLASASELMRNTLLPAAETLDGANFSHLQKSYDAGQKTLVTYQGLMLLGGGALIAVLIAAQFYVMQKTRRLINLPMAGATLVTALFVFVMFGVLTTEKARIRAAKEDGFDSIRTLYKARAVAFDANGDESFYLLVNQSEPGIRQSQRARYTQQFNDKSKLVADAPPLQIASVRAPASGQKVNFKGYLADELNNITFNGEKEAAEKMTHDYAAYLRIDEQIRRLEESGRHDAAVTLCTGVRPDQSNGAFDLFNQSLGAVLKINQDEFDKTVSAAFGTFKWAMPAAPVFALLIAISAWFGLHQRIREYSA